MEVKMISVSRRFREAVKLADRPAYKIAWDAGIHPVLLSKILHGYARLWPNDRRVLAVGKILGLRSEECFSFEERESPPEEVEKANAHQ